MSHQPTSYYRPDIDGLRALAVLAVLVFHAFPTMSPGGFTGVDVFFVISGYLITRNCVTEAQSGKFTFFNFYARRVRRLFPALLVVFGFVLVAGWLWLLPRDFQILGKDIIAAATFWVNIRFYSRSGYFNQDSETNPLLHLWSLSVEEQFYIIWPTALLLILKGGKRAPLYLSLLIIASFVANLVTSQVDLSAAFYLPYSRMWQPLMGGALAYISVNGSRFDSVLKKSSWRAEGVALVGLLLIALAYFGLSGEMIYPSWRAMLPTLGAVFLIAAGAETKINKYILSNKFAVFIGLISYPLYLWHWPLLVFPKHVFDPAVLTPTFNKGLLLLSVLAAYLTYVLVERPLRFRKRVIRQLAPAMAIIVLCGALVAENKGFQMRWPKELRQLMAYEYDFINNYRHRKCFLDEDQQSSEFSKECFFTESQREKVLLWGDSHAAHLYPGLHEHLQANRSDLAQLTAGGCPPVLGQVIQKRKYCKDLNDFIFEYINSKKPRTVIMAGYWTRYDGHEGWDALDTSKVLLTVNELKKAGVERIIFVGPVPIWHDSLPASLARYYATHEKFPEKMAFGLSSSPFKVENNLRTILSDAPVSYYSVLELFCENEVCQTFVSEGSEDLITWDYGHLTTKGSALVVKEMF